MADDRSELLERVRQLERERDEAHELLAEKAADVRLAEEIVAAHRRFVDTSRLFKEALKSV